MQIQCDYCKNWIEDTVEKCPYCGAANGHLKRYAETTPHTIAELKEWYTARNLPPEETTRFFIGKDYKAPKAFGIYQDGKNFVVYKNKADGSRAVRYKGPDEAYAVNELYLKLKEEILHQKARNMSKQSNNVSRGNDSVQYEPLTPEQAKKKAEQEKAYRRFRLIAFLIIGSIVAPILLGIGSCSVKIYNKLVRGDWYAMAPDPVFYRVMLEDFDTWEWWKYTDGDWVSFGSTDDGDLLPWDITEEHHYSSKKKVEKAFGISIPDLKSSHAYMDLHPDKPKKSYYYANDRLWYYMVDDYGSRYGMDRNGWYYYDEDDTNWHYLSRYYDNEQVPEELYYDSDSYRLTDRYSKLQSDYAYVFPAGFVWADTSDFEKSSYYDDVQWSKDRYQEEQRENRNNDNDNDHDYDWDDDDDWDYNDYDWDSDW